MEKEVLNQITLKMGLISGFIFLAIITPLRIYWRKKALEKIKSTFIDGEKIIYKLETPFSVNYIASFCCGGFFGSFILPFFIFKNLNNVGAVSKLSLFYFIPAELLILFVIILIFSTIEVITNIRVKKLSDIFVLNKVIKKIDLPISEIKSISYQKFLFFDQVDIKTYDNNIYSLAGYKEMKKVKSYLDNLIRDRS